MSELIFISETAVRDLIISEGERGVKESISSVKNPAGFSKHLINVGNLSYDVARKMLGKHPTLKDDVDARVVRTAGYMHDFAKMGYGTEKAKLPYGEMYHDFTGAHAILSNGLEWELVIGGTEGERREALRRIAICLPGDWDMEETGGENFPEGALYGTTPEFEAMIDELKIRLSPNKEKLTMLELSIPTTLERQIGVYGDLIDTNERNIGGALARIREVCERYDKCAKEAEADGRHYEALYLRTQSKVSKGLELQAKMAVIVSSINQLAGIK